MDLNGKTVLVTGGAIRVGAEICRAFAEKGARLVVHCSRSVAEAHALIDSLGGESAGHRVAVCDLNSPEDAAEMIRRFAPISVLVNNAASYARSTLAEESPADAMRQYHVNFHSPVAMIRAFAEQGAGEASGAVVNLLDQAITSVDPHSFSYAISKKMLADATRAAALQYAPRIRVNAVAPGPVLAPKGLEHLHMRKTLETLPMKRPVALRDLAASVVFLAENESITGEILFTDCGQSLL